MSAKIHQPIDAKGNQLGPGDRVTFLFAPPELVEPPELLAPPELVDPPVPLPPLPALLPPDPGAAPFEAQPPSATAPATMRIRFRASARESKLRPPGQ